MVARSSLRSARPAIWQSCWRKNRQIDRPSTYWCGIPDQRDRVSGAGVDIGVQHQSHDSITERWITFFGKTITRPIQRGVHPHQWSTLLESILL